MLMTDGQEDTTAAAAEPPPPPQRGRGRRRRRKGMGCYVNKTRQGEERVEKVRRLTYAHGWQCGHKLIIMDCI